MERLHNKDITCIFCGVDTATWRRDFRTSQITVTVPICKRCSELPEHILIEQLKPLIALKKVEAATRNTEEGKNTTTI